MVKKFVVLFFLSIVPAQAEQFISLNLCTDRLLSELARPEQIAAQSTYANNPLMMLDKLNHTKPALEPHLADLLPYLDKTVLLNDLFYPDLANQLEKLGVKLIKIRDPQTKEELFELILTLGKAVKNEVQAVKLVEKLANSDFHLKETLTETLILSDTGVVEPNVPQYQALLDLLGLTPLKNGLTAQHFSLEKLLLSQPNWLIQITDKNGYNEQAELLHHPILQKIFKNRPLATIPLKYSYCFDHGIWRGAEQIYQQLK